MANTSSGGGGECSTTTDVAAAGADAAHNAKRKQQKRLSSVVFWILLLEWAGHAVGTLAFLWATVVMLGGFSTMLSRIDFWFSTIMVFIEGTRVFVRSDTSVSQWLFGSTRAFRWDDFSYPPVPQWGKEFTVATGVGISFIPLDHLRPEIAGGILKVALLVIFSKLLTARNRFVTFFLWACTVYSIFGPGYGWYKMLTPHKPTSKHANILAFGKVSGVFLGWWCGLSLVGGVASTIGSCLREGFEGIVRWTMDCCLKAMVASALACLPFLQARLGSRYKFVSVPIAVALYGLSNGISLLRLRIVAASDYDGEQNNALLLPTPELLVRILDRFMPILVLWSVVSPFPGISLRISFYILFSLLAAALVGNLQIPVAFLQVLLSGMRLHSLLGHHHHRAYDPLPDGATTNLVPSIVVFYLLELCQGSAYIMGTVMGIVSFRHRRSLVHALGLSEKEWGAKAVNLYQHHIYEARTAKGLFPKEKYRPPSLQTFAIESLGRTSSQMDIVRLHVLHHYVYLLRQHHQDAEKEELIVEIEKNANKGITTKVIWIVSSLAADLSDNPCNNSQMLLSSLRLSVTLLWELATIPGKIGARFRQELLENSPLLLSSAQRILGARESRDSRLPLDQAMINIVATLAMDEGARQEIGSNQAIIATLVGTFRSEENLRAAAGEALANLTIMSTENCWAILKAHPPAGHHLIKDLVTMLQLQDDKNICIIAAANLLRNLCANSGDMLIHDLGAKEDLRSALKKVMETIKTTEEGGKQLEATLCAASQIGYVIPEYFAEELDGNLVKMLVDTLRNRRPRPECPRIRRALIELVICIVRLCPVPYTNIFRELGVKEALDMVKATSLSRLEKYMLFVGDEGMVLESTPMSCLVDEAIKLFNY